MIADTVYSARMRTRSDRKLLVFMLAFSLFLHAGLAAIATARWGIPGGKSHFAPVYSVDLVSLPSPSAKKYSESKSGIKAGSRSGRQTIPIQRFRAKEEPLSLRKKQRADLPTEEAEEVKLAEKTLTKIDRRPSTSPAVSKKAGETTGGRAVSQKKVALENIGGMKGGELSQALGLYRALVNEKIESNWVYPEQLGADKGELEAVVVVRARRDGTLADIQFERKSGNPYFDESVLKAILKSKPFPPFPDIYSPIEEEIVIRFSPANVS